MNEFLRKFDNIRFVAPWSILRIFLGIFHFFEFKFEFWIWAGLVPVQTGTGPDRFDRLPVKPDWFPPVWWTLVTSGEINFSIENVAAGSNLELSTVIYCDELVRCTLSAIFLITISKDRSYLANFSWHAYYKWYFLLQCGSFDLLLQEPEYQTVFEELVILPIFSLSYSLFSLPAYKLQSDISQNILEDSSWFWCSCFSCTLPDRRNCPGKLWVPCLHYILDFSIVKLHMVA